MMRIPWHSEHETWRGCLPIISWVAEVEDRSRRPYVSLLFRIFSLHPIDGSLLHFVSTGRHGV